MNVIFGIISCNMRVPNSVLGRRWKLVCIDGNQLCVSGVVPCEKLNRNNKNSFGGIVGRFIKAAIDWRILSANTGNGDDSSNGGGIAENFSIR